MTVTRVLHIGSLLLAFAAALAAAQDGERVAARVDGQPIYAAEVDRLVRESLKDREVPADARAVLAKQSLEQLISRRLILARLAREGGGAAAEEIERAVQTLQKRAQGEMETFEEWLKQNAFTLTSLRDEVAWRIAWRRHLAAQITDATLEQHFQQRRRHFDGSQVHAGHILWKLDASRDAAAEKAAIESAQQVRNQIVAGGLTFAQAAQKHSAAPSRGEGGQIGFIPRHGVMDEAFSRAAFDLEPAKISPPVVTQFGVHLIQCVEVRPGEKTWKDCREELTLAVSQEFFDRLAAEERRRATVVYDGVTR